MAITRIKNNQITDATITNVKILSQTLTGDLMNPNLTFNSNLVLNGNLTVTGNVTAVQSTTTQITDPLLTLGLGNSGTSYDLGLVLIRGSGGNRFIGFKENEGAFVFINTTEDGLTTGNIATTAYSNVIFGNAVTLGSSTFGGITLSGNTISAAGILTVRSDAGTVTIPNATIISSTLSVSGATTVDSLISNAGIIATTGSFSSNLTASALTVNNSATIGGTLGVTSNINASSITLTGSLVATGPGDFDGGLQSTPIGNVAPSTALFTTVGASSNATVAALTVNGTATFGSTVGVTGTLTGAAAQFTTINGSGTATLNALNVNNAATAGTTLTVGGTATVNALVSNTTLTAASGTILGNLLVEGNLAVLGNLSYINVDTFIVEDPIIQLNTGPNGAPLSVDNNFDSGVSTNYFDTADRRTFFGRKDSSGFFEYFSNVDSETGNVVTGTYGTIKSGNLQLVSAATVGTTLSVVGNATVAALTVNGSAVVGTTLQAVAGVQATPIGNVTASTGNFTTVGATGTATVNALVSNGAVSGTTAQFTTVNGSGNATVNALTVNASAVVGTTLQAVAGIQATVIGNVTASSGAFTTLTSSGLTTFTDATDSTGPTSGAVVITGGLAVGKDLNVTTEANIGNVTINNLTITSNITNQGLNINPNGTGVTTINSGLNTSRTVINGTAANTLVVSGTQVGVNTSSFISGATFQINAVDTMLLPVGGIGDRPVSPAAGMLRFSTSQGSIEWYNGAAWAIPTGDFTVVVANSQTGNGTATLFTLPVANASTAGTIVSINGVVQQPTSAYSITGANVTFTEAPASTDVIDFRVFTTTQQVTEVTDIAGTTGLFLDLPAANSKITTIKTFGTESFSIQANSTARFTGNAEPSANITYSLGSTTNRWKDLWLSGSTIYLGNIQIQNTTGNTVSFVTSTGAPASLDVDISDPSGIQATPIGNATPSTGNFTTVDATGNISASFFTGNGRLLTGIDATSIQNGTSNVKVFLNGSISTGVGGSNVFVVSSTGATVTGNINASGVTITGSLVASGPGDFDGGLQSTPIGNATASTGSFTTLVATGTLTVNSLNGANAIINGGTSGTGNIGATGATFNTVFAKATTAQYADLAENYSGDAVYEPGTVVHFGGSQEVTLCDEDMCRRVAGVVSTNPAYLMNSHLQGIATAVALQGRVPCKVQGTVRLGDMMVSAGNGFARAEADPTLGSVIGKALADFDGIEGVIEVVVGRV